ncbi:MAG: hypothetical protein ACLPPF_21920, partial [Rhodomicrobium sp.]
MTGRPSSQGGPCRRGDPLSAWRMRARNIHRPPSAGGKRQRPKALPLHSYFTRVKVPLAQTPAAVQPSIN